MTDETTLRGYRPGAWFGILGDHATVLLPPSEKSRVAALWELVDGGAGFDEVLDALISGGLRSLPGFVLVSEWEADTKVVVRGDARVRVVSAGEEVELVGSAATTWVEQTLPDVTSVVVDLDGDAEGQPAGVPLRVAGGLVRVGRLETPAPPEVEQRADPEVEQRAPASVVETPAPDSAPQPDDQPDDDTASTPVTDESHPTDHDGLTLAGAAVAGPMPPGIPGQQPAPPVTNRPVARLVLSHGETVEVDRAVVIGRAPEARRFPASEQPRLVTVPSPAQEISSTHLEIRPGSGVDHGSAVVTDLGSTNGTVLVQPGLPPEDLQPGIATQLIPGAILDLGDGVTIQVVNP